MNLRIAIQAGFLGCSIVAAVGIWNLSLVGRYQLHASDRARAWRIDARTGDLSFCVNLAQDGPRCLPWSSLSYREKTKPVSKNMSDEEFEKLMERGKQMLPKLAN